MVHAGNRGPTNGVTMSLCKRFDVICSFCHPVVSDQNSYIESVFEILKYPSTYPGRFAAIEMGRRFMT